MHIFSLAERQERGRCVVRHTCLALAIAALAAAFSAQAADHPPIPPEARRVDVDATTFKVNGVTSRVSGFISPRSPSSVAKWYRQQLGEPLAENKMGNRQILGKEWAGQYITVQLESAGQGTKGLVSIASLKDIQRGHDAELAARERWQNRLPNGSQLLSRIESVDAGQTATFIAFVNGHDELLNQESLKRILREEGLQLERTTGGGLSPAAASGRAMTGTTMYFKGSGKEGMATVFRTGDAQTAVILNLTTVTGSEQ